MVIRFPKDFEKTLLAFPAFCFDYSWQDKYTR